MTQPDEVLDRLSAVIANRKAAGAADAATSYVARLLERGPDAFLKKIGEEAAELVMAAKDAEHGGPRERVVSEAADLWFHCLVALAWFDLSARDVLTELARREGISGLQEKASRAKS